MGSCQLGSSSICIVSIDSISSMLDWSRCSSGMEQLNWVSSADPRLASGSACAFSARSTYWMASEQCLVFCLAVRGREAKRDSLLQQGSIKGGDDNTCSSSLLVRRSIYA
ncbi:hypothetical protein L3X38_002938 [Prunus dulcis]|uniref:Uncharacterized protein n=1 Tax=Prunus dulcis TaxID=3755 RepID=A0AAD4ZKG8_PRUDU|nr:hypothetical protein L3X38_002938 [Prunus dulcis]